MRTFSKEKWENIIRKIINQVKHYIKKESPMLFDDINRVVEKSIKKVKEHNYNNYFLHAFRSDTLLKPRKTRKRIPKAYKIDT